MTKRRTLNVADLLAAHACVEGTASACLGLRKARCVKAPRAFWAEVERIVHGDGGNYEEFRRLAAEAEIELKPRVLSTETRDTDSWELASWAWSALEPRNKELFNRNYPQYKERYHDWLVTRYNAQRERHKATGYAVQRIMTDAQIATQVRTQVDLRGRMPEIVQADPNDLDNERYRREQRLLFHRIFVMLGEQEEWDDGR